MKHKTWFRLLLKVVGIFLLATGVPGLVNSGAMVLLQLRTSAPYWGPAPYDLATILQTAIARGLAAHMLTTIIGAYLLIGGKVLTDLCIPSNRPYCPNCGYALQGLAADRCPECGARLPADLVADAKASLSEGGATPEEAEAAPQTGFRRLVPLRNRHALMSYYLAVVSLIPIAGIVLGPAAVVYGIEGLTHARQHPSHGGRTHAWTGIALGGVTTLVNMSGWCILPAILPP